MRASSIHTAILELLKSSSPGHLPANEIYEHIRQRLPAVNPSSVYRALERLAKAGTISVSDMGHGASVYEFVAQHRHHHLVCQNCGQTFVLSNELVDGFFQQVDAAAGFNVTTNHLVLFGLCENCQKTLSQESSPDHG